MYEIVISDLAEKQLSKFSSDLKIRISSKIERIKFRPYHFVKRKAGTKYYILRIGDYRAILDIVNDKLIIYVIEIGPRKKVYN